MSDTVADLADSRLPAGFRVALDPRTKWLAGRRVALGGSPWKVVRFAEGAADWLTDLSAAGPGGLAAQSPTQLRLARLLLDRGLAHPVVVPRPAGDIEIVVPLYGSAAPLRGCLSSLASRRVVVVDDGSPDPSVAEKMAAAAGAEFVVHDDNRGPAAARNTGFRQTSSSLVAFVDADCRPPSGWLDQLVGHFDDARVSAVAPRIVPLVWGNSALARYEEACSALDMGDSPALVVPGGRTGYVPSAALVVRRQALLGLEFDETLRTGEDVDLVWRLVDAGGSVRYDPSVRVGHVARTGVSGWMGRRWVYGTSAAPLAGRHPGRLAPLRASAWTLGTVVLLANGRPWAAAVTAGAATYRLHRKVSHLGVTPTDSLAVVGRAVLANAESLGHVLRREWVPAGLLSLAVSANIVRRLPAVRPLSLPLAASACMLVPIVVQWRRQRPDLGPLSYLGLRLVDDAAYGLGVLTGAWRERSPAAWMPAIGTS